MSINVSTEETEVDQHFLTNSTCEKEKKLIKFFVPGNPVPAKPKRKIYENEVWKNLIFVYTGKTLG